jgi:hypothetical protein
MGIPHAARRAPGAGLCRLLNQAPDAVKPLAAEAIAGNS